MRRVAAAVTILALGTVLIGCAEVQVPDSVVEAYAVDDGQPVTEQYVPGSIEGTRNLMKAKLSHAQAVLEGLATEDFDQVKSNAEFLHELSKATDWQVHRTVAYSVLSTEFRRIVQEMTQHAREKNQHAVTLDYMQMVMTCVKCHSHMRHEGLTSLDDGAWMAAIGGQ